jgi:predicted  nucleic acid-binding Zn-ribbon protein
MTVAVDLAELQDVDLALDRSRARLEQIAQEIQETEELREARAVKEEKERVLTGLRSRQRELEWEVDEVRKKASGVETKLYSGSIRNPKELQDLDAEMKSLKAQTARREDVLLSLLVEVEEAETELRLAAGNLASIEGEWAANRERLLKEKEELEPEVERLQAQRAERESAIDGAALSLYELLRSRKGGQAVARVERGMCQGCRITLPMLLLQKARTGAGLVQCVSCERILLVN